MNLSSILRVAHTLRPNSRHVSISFAAMTRLVSFSGPGAGASELSVIPCSLPRRAAWHGDQIQYIIIIGCADGFSVEVLGCWQCKEPLLEQSLQVNIWPPGNFRCIAHHCTVSVVRSEMLAPTALA